MAEAHPHVASTPGVEIDFGSLRQVAPACNSKLARSAVDSLSLFHERLHPAKHSFPAFAVIGRVFHIAGKSAVRNLNHRAGAHLLRTFVLQAMNTVRLQLPPHDG